MSTFSHKIYDIDKIKQCPCYDCLCIPICKGRKFIDMTSRCENLQYYMYHDPACGSDPRKNDDYYDRLVITLGIIKDE